MKFSQFAHDDEDSSVYRLVVYTLLLIFSNLPSSNAHKYDRCWAHTPSGTYRGRMKESVFTSKNFCSFLGIQYGQPPVGDLRFEYPLLAKPLKPGVVFNAYEDGNPCTQIRSNVTEGSEDCLYLNVFTPEPPGKCQHLKPVLVFVHPGGFFFGSGSSKQFSPDFIIHKGVVFVTINHRLNVFGFLNYNVSSCGGNMGLRDQVLALRWIQKNIRSFGGDPNRVTLSGESSGALSVYLVALSSLSRGLLHRIIPQSPVFQSSLDAATKQASIDFAKYMGYKGNPNNPGEIVRYLKQLSAKDLVSGYGSFTTERSKGTVMLSQPFRPSPDASLGETAFFKDTLEQLGKEVPGYVRILVGQDNLDGAFVLSSQNLEQTISTVRQRFSDFFPSSAYTKQRLAKLKKYYFGGARNTLDLLIGTINVVTDSVYFYFYQQFSIFKKPLCKRHIWMYQYSYNGTLEHFKMSALGNYSSRVRGAVHGEELNYLYLARIFYPHLTPAQLTTKDRKIMYELTTLWTNFVKTGNPNSYGDEIEVEWKPISAARKSYLEISSNLYFVDSARIDEKRRRVLDSLMTYPKKDNDPCYCRKS